MLGISTAGAAERYSKSDIGNNTFPQPFDPTNVNGNTPPISTGYFFSDTRDLETPTYWRPTWTLVPLTYQGETWKRIGRGPKSEKVTPYGFFRNPANPNDSTDNAVAGPIPLGLGNGFMFNGIRYDSFYVSTNGVIALTNRRYFYDNQGLRTIPKGGVDAYDPQSMDWYVAGRARQVGAASLTDPVEDNFGYQYAVMGGLPATDLKGIRANDPSGSRKFLDNDPGMSNFELENKGAFIAPFWGSLRLSQWNKYTDRPEDYSQAWYKLDYGQNKLTIYLKNYQAYGPQYGPPEGSNDRIWNAPADQRPSRGDTLAQASAQIVLDRTDSSITINYEKFEGVAYFLVGGNTTRGIKLQANYIFQSNTVCGVRGFARQNTSTNQEYVQLTNYYNKNWKWDVILPTGQDDPITCQAVKFRQYKNVLRVVGNQYLVRTQENDGDLSFKVEVPTNAVADYELLAGEQKLGALQPVVIIQNLTNDVQGVNGVNYIPQPAQFQARFRIENEATDEIVYSSIVPVNNVSLSTPATTDGVPNYERVEAYTAFDPAQASNQIKDPNTLTLTGIKPYNFAKVYFRPFEPSAIDSRYHGRLKAYIIADPINPFTKEAMGDQWPFDDTTKIRIWVMKRLNGFKDDVSEFYSLSAQGDKPFPSVMKWVTIGADVLPGDIYSYYPLAPRGRFADVTRKNIFIESPVIHLNRLTEDGQEYQGQPYPADGDQVRSFPIILNSEKNPVLTLSIQRGMKPSNPYERGFGDNNAYGPEPRILSVDNTKYSKGYSQYTDSLEIDFALPSSNGLKDICNISETNWKTILNSDGTRISASPYVIFGSGGYQIGFSKTNKNLALRAGSDEALQIDQYDDGFDWDYKKVFIPIPDYILKDKNNGNRNFRFRAKLMATDYKAASQSQTEDDKDDILIDNIAIIDQSEDADIEISSVKVRWPYTAVPATQALSVPIYVKVYNNTSLDAKSFSVKAFILKGMDTVYCNYLQKPVLRAGASYDMEMPAWNARKTGPGNYRVCAQLYYVGNTVNMKDVDTSNDFNYYDVNMVFNETSTFTYENGISLDGASNHVWEEASKLKGRGLNLYGYSYGGLATNKDMTGPYDPEIHATGVEGGNGSGQIAVKFTLLQPDTVYGVHVYFANLSQDRNYVAIGLYQNAPKADASTVDLPGQFVNGSEAIKLRGMDDYTNVAGYNKYITYKFNEPIFLNAGIYWVAVSQLGEVGLELGAVRDRMAMRTTKLDFTMPYGQELEMGKAGVNLLVNKDLRIYNDRTGNWVNENLFAYQNTRNEGAWMAFMPTQGNPGYAHLDHLGITPINQYSFTRGTWVPMIRPYFGPKEVGQSSENIPCPSPIWSPVNLASFNAQVRNSAVELMWETTKEDNNKGFYVEKTNANSQEWKDLGFIEGKGDSKLATEYNYIDKDVKYGASYKYRLRQVDRTGDNCPVYSEAVVVNIDAVKETSLEQNMPNPFTVMTSINFTTAQDGNVTLEIVDIYGNTVKTLVNEYRKADAYNVAWSGLNEEGKQVANGTYVYRLTVNKDVKIGKMTLVR
jgi:hypothetical protein